MERSEVRAKCYTLLQRRILTNGAKVEQPADYPFPVARIVNSLSLADVKTRVFHDGHRELDKKFNDEWSRVQGASDADAIKQERGSVLIHEGNPSTDEDPLQERANRFVLLGRRAGIPELKSEFHIGYNRAARLIENMERDGLISQMDCSGKRVVLKRFEESPVTSNSHNRCDSCGAHLVFLKTTKGRMMPVNYSGKAMDDKRDGVPFDPVRHETHFATCPAAAKHRKRGGQSVD
jgi:hypothetical protein